MVVIGAKTNDDNKALIYKHDMKNANRCEPGAQLYQK